MHEARLIEAVQGGDTKAFGSLVETHQVRLYRAACCLTRSASEAEDLAQETFVRAYRALGRFRGDCSFYTWLFAILLNVYRGWVRRERRRGRAQTNNPDVAAASPSPSRSIAARDDLERVLRVIDGLPHKLREVLVLRHLEAMSYDEIARAVGCRPGTVRSRLHRARALLAVRCRQRRGDESEIAPASFAQQGGTLR